MYVRLTHDKNHTASTERFCLFTTHFTLLFPCFYAFMPLCLYLIIAYQRSCTFAGTSQLDSKEQITQKY